MRRSLMFQLIASVYSLSAYNAGALAEHPNEVVLALAGAERPADDLKRDAARKPAEVLGFFGVSEGMSILELGAGGGFITEAASHVVGDQGLVIGQSPFQFLQFTSDEIKSRYGSGRLANVVIVYGALEKLKLPSDSIDVVLIIDTYHDIAYRPETGETQSGISKEVLVEARRVLKKGGVVGVVDHAAKDGARREDASKLHRIVEKTARSDFEKAGFKFDGSKDFLRNPNDDKTKAWFEDPALKDNTDRFVHRYRSPD